MAITEPEAGSDAGAIKCRARRDGDDWVINGSKIFITNGSIASTVIVIAVTDPDAGPVRASRAFIVETDNPGFVVGAISTRWGRVRLRSLCCISTIAASPATRCWATRAPRCGKSRSNASTGNARVMIASSIGGMKSSLDAAIDYAKERVAFGKPIAKHQAIQHKLAEMKA